MDSTEIGFSDRDTRSRSVLDLNVSATEAAVATGEFLSFSGDGLADEGCAAFPSDVPRWKRALDIALILIAFPVVFPVMMLVAAVIRIGSPGPVLFTQERVGYRSRRFRLYKFRTMAVGANTSVHQQHFSHLISSNLPMAKMDTKGDSRLIPLGRLLRASGLDELPQGINVLLGDMSLVGPRPCIPYEYEKYLPWHKERFNTLPGLTGL